MSDPFATAAVRERVLASWAAAPVRLREDANAEEDLALGGYRDRLVVELAQNAADAASRSGAPGRLALTLRERVDGAPVLVAANTGEPLTAQGVQSLATLRASAKTDDVASIGRFGVGFASVLAVTDEPILLSRTGGARFSRDDTAALVDEAAHGAPALAQEVRRRDGHVPVLRLPFAAEGEPPSGFDTAVVLPLRDEAAADLVREQLAAVDDALLLALPALAEVTIDVDGRTRTLADAASRWHVLRRAGDWDAAERSALLGDRPTEERRQRGWQVLWALPRRADVPVPRTVHAPTPTDEPLTLPALLLATFPLDPTRRHVAAGALTDRLVLECASGYADLLHERARAGDDIAALVPTGLPGGALDGALREAVLGLAPGRPLLRSVEDPGELIRPRDAVTLDVPVADHPDVLAALAPVVAGLVAAPHGARAALAALGVRRLPLSDVIDALPTRGEPRTWQRLYAGLATLADDANAREALAAVPVPLADGRVVRGARGLLVADDGRLPAAALAALSEYGLRVVHPEAAHPLLARLGAEPATARTVLEDASARLAVAASPDAAEPDELADAVLAVVAAALADGVLTPGEMPWLGDLALTDSRGDLAPAGALAIAGSFAARVLDPETIGELAADAAERWPREALAAVGVLDGLGQVLVADVDLDDPPESLAELDGFDRWARDAGPGTVAELAAVRDLDCVMPESWPEALRHMASEPQLRRALVGPVRVVTSQDRATDVTSYVAWWLRAELGLVGCLDPSADTGLAGLLDRGPGWVDELDQGVRAALGLVRALGDAAPDASLAALLLERMADPARTVGAATCLHAWRLLASSALDADPPERVRVLHGTGSRVVDADDAVVADDPRWLQRGDLGGLVVAPAGRTSALADLLDVALASEVAAGRVERPGTPRPVPDAVRAVLPGAPGQWREHDVLSVDGQGVDWWVDDQGAPHAATRDGLARALAWAGGDWRSRYAVAHLLADPDAAAGLAAEDAAG